MAEVTFIADHETQILRRLLAQFSESTNLRAFLSQFGEAAQDVEDAGKQLIEERTIADAEGEQLDMLGVIVGQPRGGDDDDTYRTAILARIAANTSTSDPESVMAVLRIATQTENVRLLEVFPMKMWLYTEGEDVPDNIYDVIRAAAPATTGIIVILTTGGVDFADAAFTSEYLASIPSNFALLSEWDVTGLAYLYEGASLAEWIVEPEE